MLGYKPAIVHGEIIEDYWVCPKKGDIWTTKATKPKRLSPNIAGNTPYPKVTLFNNGKRIHVYVHKIVCETLHPFPVPEGVTKTEWKNTPASVRKLLNSLFQVNHKDHVHTNFHPSNLEWVTAKQNAKKYQEHRTKV